MLGSTLSLPLSATNEIGVEEIFFCVHTRSVQSSWRLNYV